jgi:hypothetical protein
MKKFLRFALVAILVIVLGASPVFAGKGGGGDKDGGRAPGDDVSLPAPDSGLPGFGDDGGGGGDFWGPADRPAREVDITRIEGNIPAAASAETNATIVERLLDAEREVGFVLSRAVSTLRLSGDTADVLIEAEESLAVQGGAVSVVFSVENLAHLNIENEIEIRIVTGDDDTAALANGVFNRPLMVLVSVDGEEFMDAIGAIEISVDLSGRGFTAAEVANLRVGVAHYNDTTETILPESYELVLTFEVTALDAEYTVMFAVADAPAPIPVAQEVEEIEPQEELVVDSALEAPVIETPAADIRIRLTVGSLVYTNNGITGEMAVAPMLYGGRTMVPVRFFSDSFGSEIDWESASQTVTIAHNGEVVSFRIGETLPGMDVAAMLYDGRTMVPLRFVSEFFGAGVDWNPATQAITINA